MKPYPDTNFFTRLYLALPDSEEADALLDEARTGKAAALPVTWLHRVETVNAFQLSVFVGRLPGQTHVTPEQAASALAGFREDILTGAFFRATPLVLEKLEFECEALALRHTARHGFRTYDLLHVASALALQCDTFWSFDPKASKLARLEGLATRGK
jgi:predicted nucleic acid-binding protein